MWRIWDPAEALIAPGATKAWALSAEGAKLNSRSRKVVGSQPKKSFRSAGGATFAQLPNLNVGP